MSEYNPRFLQLTVVSLDVLYREKTSFRAEIRIAFTDRIRVRKSEYGEDNQYYIGFENFYKEWDIIDRRILVEKQGHAI